jgi:hypothetical protein
MLMILPLPLLAHHWQHRFDHTKNTKQVRFELSLDIGETALFDRADLSIASSVDQDINPPDLCKQRLDGCLHGGIRADIQGQSPIRACELVGRATGSKDNEAASRKQLCCRLPDA